MTNSNRSINVVGPRKNTLMVVGAGPLQLPAIETGSRLGYRVLAVDRDPSAVGFSHADISVIASTLDVDAVLGAATSADVSGVMTMATDAPVRTVSAVAQALGLRGLPPEVALTATHKGLMRECLVANGVPAPKFFRCRTRQEYERAGRLLGGRFVVKPVDSSGSRGVFLIDDEQMSDSGSARFDEAMAFSRDGEVIVEEFMDGPEVSVEMFTSDGLTQVVAVTDKTTSGAPHFVEMGHVQPSSLDPEVLAEVERVSIRAVRALQITSGPAHVEVIVTRSGPSIVEVGPRLGGDYITSHLVPLSTGVDLVAATIQECMGTAPDVAKSFDRGAAVRYLTSRPSVIDAVRGVREVLTIPGVVTVVVPRPGDVVTEVSSSSGRVGHVIAFGLDRTSAIQACDRAVRGISLDVTDDTGR